jgi:hypothetical protein
MKLRVEQAVTDIREYDKLNEAEDFYIVIAFTGARACFRTEKEAGR